MAAISAGGSHGAPLLGQPFPTFSAMTSQGPMEWHKYIEGHWAILFSHPFDYTPVCTTELGTVAKMMNEFTRRNVKVAALSCNDVDTHHGWIKDIIASQGLSGKDLPYPIIADADRSLAIRFGMLDPVEQEGGMPLTARAVFIINPAKKLALSILYPATTGRNFDEILRVIDSLQLTVKHKCATPANWVTGKDCMVIPSVSDEEAKTIFPKGVSKVDVPSGKGYLRMTPDPRFI